MSIDEKSTETVVSEEQPQGEEVEQTPTEASEQQSESTEEISEDEDEVVSYSFGDEATPPQEESPEFTGEAAPEWVKDLRKADREKAKENKRLKKELEDLKNQYNPVQEIKLKPKPKIEDFDYDSDEYEKALDTWYVDKTEFEKQETVKKETVKKREENFNNKIQNYNTNRDTFKEKTPDFEEIEQDVSTSLGDIKIEIALASLDKPTDFVYALGKNASKLEELSKINVQKDDLHSIIEFASTVAKLEASMKTTTTKRKPKSKPEETIVSNGSLSNADKQLEKLREDAAKSGDFTKVRAYKKLNNIK